MSQLLDSRYPMQVANYEISCEQCRRLSTAGCPHTEIYSLRVCYSDDFSVTKFDVHVRRMQEGK